MPKGPRKLGLTGGKFYPCPENRICVSSMSPKSDKKHYMEPIPYDIPLKEAKEGIIKVILSFKRTEIHEISGNYIYCSFSTVLFHWTDDIEFLFDNKAKLIHFKSQTRINGYYDWGKNRSRMKKIKKKFNRLE